MTTKKLSKDDLAARSPDDEWRRRFVELSDLVGFLGDCVISDHYKPSDALNAAVHLSELGNKMVRELTRQSVPTKEARLMCLVQTAHRDPLVDVAEVDLDALRDAIGAEILSGALRFPFVYGRALYDRAADLHADLRHSLTGEETLALLDGTPIGVFQHGRFLSGPYGLLQSVQSRQLQATRRVPLFTCADLSCTVVHSCTLGTGWDAPVNDHRNKLTKLLQQQSKEPSDWGDFSTTSPRISGSGTTTSTARRSPTCWATGCPRPSSAASRNGSSTGATAACGTCCSSTERSPGPRRRWSPASNGPV